MKQWLKRAAAIMLSLCLCLNLVQVNAWAAEFADDQLKLIAAGEADSAETEAESVAEEAETVSAEEETDQAEEKETEAADDQDEEKVSEVSEAGEKTELESEVPEAEDETELETEVSETEEKLTSGSAEEKKESLTDELQIDSENKRFLADDDKFFDDEYEDDSDEIVVDGEEVEDDEDEETPAHEHTYMAEFKWSSDHASCQAIIQCDECDEINIPRTCSVTKTNTSNGVVYTATVIYEGKTMTDEYVDAAATGVHGEHMWYRYNQEGNIDIRGYAGGKLVQTTFNDVGYNMVMSANGAQQALRFSKNGTAVTHSSGLTVTPNVSVKNGAYAIVTLTVRNKTNSTQTYSLNINADIDIDDDDEAVLQKNGTGVTMTSANNIVYYLACKNVKGIENVDTIWVGSLDEKEQHYFDDNGSGSVSGLDSAFNCAWVNRTLAPGEVASYSYEVGIGTGDEIDAPEEHHHVYGEPAFKWEKDNSSCTAEFSCDSCDLKQTVACDVASEIDEDENTVFTAVAVFNEKEYTDTQVVEKEVHKHSYGAPVFKWEKDNSFCKAVFTCEECDEEESVDCKVKDTVTDSTCTKTGKTVYKASVTFNDKEYTAQKTKTLELKAHSYGSPEFKWNMAEESCKAVFTCSACNDVQTKGCDVETLEKGYLYKATVEFKRQTYDDTKHNETTSVNNKNNGETVETNVYIQGSDAEIVITCSIPKQYFVDVTVDGILVDPSNYTVVEGSTVLTFASSYLDTLTPGNHAVAMNYDINGRSKVMTTTIKVKPAPTSEPVRPTQKPNHAGSSNGNGNSNGNNNRPAPAPVPHRPSPVPMTAHLVDVNDAPMHNYTLEMHSNPMTAVLNENGLASFKNIEAGDHTMYLKDESGSTIASKAVKIAFSDSYSISGNVINVQENRSFTLNVRYANDELILLSVEGGSPITGDQTDMMMWVLLMLSALTGIVIMVSKKRNRAA